MTEWCMAHPWMTFFIILAMIHYVANAIASFGRQRTDM
jgi:hypothetical protein